MSFVQTKGGFHKSALKSFPRFDIDPDQLYLLTVFPEVTGVSGLLFNLTIRLHNLSGMLGSYGFFAPPGDLAFASARTVRNSTYGKTWVRLDELEFLPVLEVPGWPWLVDYWSSATTCSDLAEFANAWTGFSFGEAFDPRSPKAPQIRSFLKRVAIKHPALVQFRELVLESDLDTEEQLPQSPEYGGEDGTQSAVLALTISQSEQSERA